MILTLNIIDHNKASWLIIENGRIRYNHNFAMAKGEESSLLNLDKLLKSNKLSLRDITDLVLAVKDASLTQVKVFTAIINTIGWQFDLPLAADYYFKGDFKDVLPGLLKKLEKQRKFAPLKAKYKQKSDISISRQKPKYTIIK